MVEDRITKYFKGLLKLGANPRLLSFVYNSHFIAGEYQIHVQCQQKYQITFSGFIWSCSEAVERRSVTWSITPEKGLFARAKTGAV